MASVQSRQHKVYKTKWSHSCQPKWLSISHDTLVQEGNYLSQSRHIWQGNTPRVSAHVIRTATSAEQDHPWVGSSANFPLAIRSAKTFIKRTEGRSAPLLVYAGSRTLLRQPSSTHQSVVPHHADLPWHRLPEALPCWTEDFVCPAAHLALETLPCKTLKTPLPTVLSSGPAD